ncbi:MAG: NAD(P)-dependent dehydrogenase (short-subunit alcohol dehydrogenase family) [Myxococcota bacterium]|jgi:NAD(P)-dependent dehydrogenase (short-subunit alcohol dehydrogenase family)
MNSQIFRDDLLAGKVALVTGGGTGIGAAITRELTRLGATVVIASRKPENIEPAAAGLTEELGRPVHGRILDIRDRESVRALMSGIVSEFGALDIVVNNGGGQFFSPAEAISDKGWDAVVATNLTGTWNVTRAAADAWMLKNGGTILNITMLTGRAFPGMAHSVAARSGVEAMTRTLAVEWANKGIRINSIAPGFVASSGIKRYPAGLELISQMRSFVPMKRLATCDEIAWAVAFLASPAGAYITGETMTIDGGKTLWGDWWPIPDPEDVGTIDIPTEPWEK